MTLVLLPFLVLLRALTAPVRLLLRLLARALFTVLAPPKRPPDFVIGDDYMRRWWLIPRNRAFNVYLHNVRHSDDDRALHDHPWVSLSLCLDGWLKEHTPAGIRDVRAGRLIFRRATSAHRLEIPDGSDGAWTLFMTGPVIRAWGFHCPQGWRHWRDFVAGEDKGRVGRGCGE